MIKGLLTASALLLSAALYPLSGFNAAWQIREAARTGDTATLARRVDWAAVRQSLKRSANDARQLFGEMSEAAGVPKLGLWQRVKAAAMPFVADPMIDRYVSAEGAAQIWAWRQTWREKVRPKLLSEPASPLSGTWLENSSLDRGLSVAVRMQRVAFMSATRLELELIDRYVAERRWQATMEFRDFTWVLTDVQMKRVPRPAVAPTTLMLRATRESLIVRGGSNSATPRS